ncbi:23 kDa integral membrane protein isoform X1 [Solenopsis invicta]|uniref:23 kDa integral membrane protein isoform X1 n=2 Tax=Solenopsis invicta TaxID=13686 RepID=UPI0005958E5B|nr:23 kDa integral membrane protein isoform X1 [Solenopsis invicta]
MGHAFACFRYCLVASAILLGISGAIMSVCAGYFIYQLHEYAPLTPDHVCGSSATLLAMGVITCGIGWFAWQFLDFSNKGQVIIFAVVLAIIVLVETSVGIWTLVRHEQIDTLSPMRHEEIFSLAVTDDKSVWEHMQSALRCCGIDGPSDYRGVNAIPWSCCNRTNHENDNNTEGACAAIYKRGCQHVVLNRTRSILLHVFLLALCSVLLQISFIACTTCYVRIYKDRMERRTSEIATRMSLQDIKEVDTKNRLLMRQAKYSLNSGDP